MPQKPFSAGLFKALSKFQKFCQAPFFSLENTKNYYNTGQKADYITKRLIRKVRIELLCDSVQDRL